ELEGPPIAREIMEKLGAKNELTEEVCDIVGHHHSPRETETTNFMAVYDADLIVNIEENHKDGKPDTDRLERIIEKSFLTKTGKQKAREVLLSQT
ncbi:MAG: phosphohydrolase, partial [Desulfobacterium sp.]|nr:phosphohydrolase [Desulfobacterium sp.]